MKTGCPGQDTRRLTVEIHRCPACRAEVEIFSDEVRAVCHNCGEKVYRETTPSCVQWCASARKCLGEERWRELGQQMSEKGEI